MGVKNFDVLAFNKTKLIDPEQVGYEDSIEIINEELHKTRKSFIKIGWYLKHIQDNKMYEQNGYANIYDFAMDKFHFSQPTTSRYINICENFSVGHDSPELDEKFAEYNISQLFEMLPLSTEQQEQISPDMTVKQIREIKKPSPKAVAVPEIGKNIKTENDNISGQTSIEENFPEYLPENYAMSHKEQKAKDLVLQQEEQIIDGEYREADCFLNIDDKLAVVKSVLNQEEQDLKDYLSFSGIPESTIMRRRIIVQALKHYVSLLEDIDNE